MSAATASPPASVPPLPGRSTVLVHLGRPAGDDRGATCPASARVLVGVDLDAGRGAGRPS